MLYRGNQNYFLDSALRSNGGQQKEDWQKKVVFVSSETIWRWGGLTPHPTHWLLLLAYLPLFPVNLTLSFKSLNKGSHQGLNTSTVIALVIISFQSWPHLSLSEPALTLRLSLGWMNRVSQSSSNSRMDRILHIPPYHIHYTLWERVLRRQR